MCRSMQPPSISPTRSFTSTPPMEYRSGSTRTALATASERASSSDPVASGLVEREDAAHRNPFLIRFRASQPLLEAIHRRLPARISFLKVGGDRARPIGRNLGDQEQAIAGAPDFHRFIPARANSFDHLGPNRAGLVRGLIGRDQSGIINQVERKAHASAHRAQNPVL